MGNPLKWLINDHFGYDENIQYLVEIQPSGSCHSNQLRQNEGSVMGRLGTVDGLRLELWICGVELWMWEL